jgi:hypothetical protein
MARKFGKRRFGKEIYDNYRNSMRFKTDKDCAVYEHFLGIALQNGRFCTAYGLLLDMLQDQVLPSPRLVVKVINKQMEPMQSCKLLMKQLAKGRPNNAITVKISKSEVMGHVTRNIFFLEQARMRILEAWTWIIIYPGKEFGTLVEDKVEAKIPELDLGSRNIVKEYLKHLKISRLCN